MLTVKLMRGGRDDPSMARYRSSFSRHPSPHPIRRMPACGAGGDARLAVKLRLTTVSDAQHGGFTTGSGPVSWGSIGSLFANLTIPRGGATRLPVVVPGLGGGKDEPSA